MHTRCRVSGDGLVMELVLVRAIMRASRSAPSSSLKAKKPLSTCCSTSCIHANQSQTKKAYTGGGGHTCGSDAVMLVLKASRTMRGRLLGLASRGLYRLACGEPKKSSYRAFRGRDAEVLRCTSAFMAVLASTNFADDKREAYSARTRRLWVRPFSIL